MQSYRGPAEPSAAGPSSETLDAKEPEPELLPVVKAEPVDPLAMDMGEEEVEYEPDQLNEDVSSRSQLPQCCYSSSLCPDG